MNEVICHGIPDTRPLKNGDIVNLDITAYLDGHHADFNETYLVGDVDDESVRLVKCAYESLRAGVSIGKATATRHIPQGDVVCCLIVYRCYESDV